MWKIRPSGSPVRAAERTLRGPCGASTGGVSSYWINSKTTTMYQHSTLCFRKHSRHRFLVTAPSIHENNFVLTSVWGGGQRGGEARNRRRTEPGAAFYLLSWSKSDTRGGPAPAAAALLALTPSSSSRSLSERSHTDKNALRLGENSDPLPPPDSGAAAAFHSRGKYVE